ncbi:MAG: hypothetical protein ACRBM6_02965 [Geminicoccales bacterium]
MSCFGMVNVMVTRDQKSEWTSLTTASQASLEYRTGFPGLGGRPSQHPAWSGATDRRALGVMLDGASRADEEFGRHQQSKERVSS